MFFALTNTLASFEHIINNVLPQFFDQFVLVYVESILIYTDNLACPQQEVSNGM